MRIKRIYPKSKTILPQPPIHAKLYFDPDEMEQIHKQFLLDEEHNNPNKTFRFHGGTGNECR